MHIVTVTTTTTRRILFLPRPILTHSCDAGLGGVKHALKRRKNLLLVKAFRGERKRVEVTKELSYGISICIMYVIRCVEEDSGRRIERKRDNGVMRAVRF